MSGTTVSKQGQGDNSSWQIALATLGDEDALDRVRMVGERGIKMRSVAVSSDEEATRRGAWLVGKREPMRAGLQQLIESTLGVPHRWLIRWLQGRWPRGPLTVHIPLDGSVDGMKLGIIAPLSPTRVALSEGPVPFDKASVTHFKGLHQATGAPGLSGCRLKFSEHNVAHVAIRWRLAPEALSLTMTDRGLTEIFAADVLPTIAALTEGLPTTEMTFEACYQPEPGGSFAVEFGPIPTGRVIGLTAALWGPDAKATLTNTAKALSQRWTHRVRLEFDAEGLKRSTALLTTADVNRADW
ncbi:MAG: hypothetical protein ACPGU1_18630 [Myxococcota bacterium]